MIASRLATCGREIKGIITPRKLRVQSLKLTNFPLHFPNNYDVNRLPRVKSSRERLKKIALSSHGGSQCLDTSKVKNTLAVSQLASDKKEAARWIIPLQETPILPPLSSSLRTTYTKMKRIQGYNIYITTFVYIYIYI